MDIDQELDCLLKARSVPSMRSNLEHRIIQASAAHEKKNQSKGTSEFFRAIGDFMDCLVLPQPAMAMVVVLVIGTALGAYSSDILLVDDTQDIEAYMLIVDDIEYEGFL